MTTWEDLNHQVRGIRFYAFQDAMEKAFGRASWRAEELEEWFRVRALDREIKAALREQQHKDRSRR